MGIMGITPAAITDVVIRPGHDQAVSFVARYLEEMGIGRGRI
jgi:hypothetical protein